jgi:tRNA modification GTPase
MRAASDTIFAVASGDGRAAVAVLRLSGPRTGALLDRMCGHRPAPRVAALRTVRDADGEVLDRALVVWFPGPASYTGEDCGELQLHGGRAVVEGAADALAALGGRPAEPGEFTRRAFLNGRMDLIEAEAVADLVEAETSAQRRQALRQLSGALGELYRGWSDRLTRLLARQEALIDFPDEDLPPEVEAANLVELAALHGEIAAHLDDGRRGERLREGLVFAIAGAPNVGKSTLLNALAGRDAAIVSPHAGTTRDVLEVRVVLGGVPVTLLDTAGLRETSDPVEAEGVRRALARAADADLRVIVRDGMRDEVRDGMEVAPGAGQIVVANKADLGTSAGAADLVISALTGDGMAALRARLALEARRLTGAGGPPALTRARHRAALSEAAARLADAVAAPLPELRGEDLRSALSALGRITGRVGAEAVLDAVFSQFCIGK